MKQIDLSPEGMMRALFIAALALGLGGCTMSQEVRGQCEAMGFEAGSDKMAECQMRLTEAAMSSPKYGGSGSAPVTPPPVAFQPLQMPQPAPRLRANCTTTAMGNTATTNCY
ncbi:MAG: hypothetical protein EOO81_05110 [Oxalobacteraceae bacterium]|nr:MAG: hypothetical protein EOO81_05110 [Oxalobacteraceae bacterium]